jgi:hypothetical protein
MEKQDLAKIPTELYICVPRRSSRGVFRANIWANLTRKDTGQGIGGKKILSYLDDVNVSVQYTAKDTGYAGPFDINPKTVGLHTTYVVFEGDLEFETCKSETITLKVDPNLLGTQIVMETSPLSGVIPLTIKVTGIVYEIAPDGSKRRPAYSLPLYLMVFDATSTRRLQTVNMVLSNPDGTYAIEYTFIKLGTYAIFVNFLGDEKYISTWSNNGRTSTITVTGGGLPLSFEKTVTVTAKESKQFKWILSQTEPTAPAGYERFPDLDLDFGVLGKYWTFIKTA